MTDIFPIELRSDIRGWSEDRYRSQFLANKAKNQIWFCYDVIIHSQELVEFVVYNIADSIYGGKGREIDRFKTIVPKSLTMPDVKRHIRSLAEQQRLTELAELEERIVQTYAARIAEELVYS